jgi:hypothetical protein
VVYKSFVYTSIDISALQLCAGSYAHSSESTRPLSRQKVTLRLSLVYWLRSILLLCKQNNMYCAHPETTGILEYTYLGVVLRSWCGKCANISILNIKSNRQTADHHHHFQPLHSK